MIIVDIIPDDFVFHNCMITDCMLKKIPNILTMFRIVMIPVLVGSFYIESIVGHWICASIFVFASITDYLDGVIARQLSAYSSFGRILDPIADKLLVASTLMMLVHLDRAPVVPAILILCREITVSGLREYMAEFKVSIPVTALGKIKTVIQMVAITILLLSDKIIDYKFINEIGNVSLWCAAIITLFTGYAYWKEGMKRLH